MPGGPATQTFLPTIFPFAARLSLRNRISKLKLAQVLSGNTCPPVSLKDFESYLAFTEHSIENLRFVAWYHDYRKRYSSATVDDAATVAFRAECQRVVATFLQPGAKEEILLEQDLRDSVILELEESCRFDLFQPIYDVVYHTLEYQSLPRFVGVMSTNVNGPRQRMFFILGITTTLLSIVLTLLLLLRLPSSPRVFRIFPCILAWMGAMQLITGWRGLCTLLWLRNGTQLRVWELEEADLETHAFVRRTVTSSLTPIPALPVSPTHHRRAPPIPSLSIPSTHASSAKLIAPFLTPPPLAVTVDIPIPSPSNYPSHCHISPTSPYSSEWDASPTRDSFKMSSIPNCPNAAEPESPQRLSHKAFQRPPLFGPDKVVHDPLIRSIHRRTIGEIWAIGALYELVFAIVVFMVPVRR